MLDSRRGRVWLLLFDLRAPSPEMSFSGCWFTGDRVVLVVVSGGFWVSLLLVSGGAVVKERETGLRTGGC